MSTRANLQTEAAKKRAVGSSNCCLPTQPKNGRQSMQLRSLAAQPHAPFPQHREKFTAHDRLKQEVQPIAVLVRRRPERETVQRAFPSHTRPQAGTHSLT